MSCYNMPFMATSTTEVRYVACWTEDDGIYSCGHDHETIPGAMECMVPGRTFIRARENSGLRSLSEGEMAVFIIELAEKRPKR
jgi:hypothetical protein